MGFRDLNLGFDNFLAIAIDLNFILQSLKQPNFVQTHDSQFVQCVSPKLNLYSRELPMSPSSLPIELAVLVVIIGETVLQDRIINLLQDLDVTGYTLSQAQGAGRHGSRRGDMVSYNTNIEIKTVVSPEVSEAIFSGLVEYQSNHALIAFRQNVEALTGFEII